MKELSVWAVDWILSSLNSYVEALTLMGLMSLQEEQETLKNFLSALWGQREGSHL